MPNKKFPKLAVLSLLGILALTGCSSAAADEIYAKPSNYDKPVIAITEGEGEASIHNNVLSLIYDSMHDGNVASKVLDKVMEKYAETVFGVFNPVIAKKEQVGEEELPITLEEAATDDTATHDKIYPFIKAHKAYWLRNDEGKHMKEDGTVINDGEDWEPGATEIQNVKSRYEDINKRIAEAMYRKAIKGSYTENHFFDEYEYIKSLWKEGAKVNFASAKTLHDTFEEDPDDHTQQRQLRRVFVDYTIEDNEVFTSGLLHKEWYQSPGYTYIEDSIVPVVYGDLLIEQYLLDEEISAVRTSSARKINVIKIEKQGNGINADKLVDHLVNAIYNVAPNADEHVRRSTSDIEDDMTDLFKSYAKVAKGLYSEIAADPVATQVVTDLQKSGSEVYKEHTYTYGGVDYVYYENTKYGDLIEDFEKYHLIVNYEDFSSTLHNKFTVDGTVSELEGLDRLTNDISQEESITKGWYVSKSKPSLDGNSKINERLFSNSVAEFKYELGGEAGESAKGSDEAQIEKNLKKVEGYLEDQNGNHIFVDGTDRYQRTFDSTGEHWTWSLREGEFSSKENKYICSINGAWFLRFEDQYATEDARKDIVYSDGSAYYIVNVIEAAKDSKLRSKGDGSYSKLRGTKILNEITSEISKKVAETGSYASLSKEYWLKKMALAYHDQKVYDYFKSNYPDLFE